MTTQEYQITGLTCEHCARAVTEEVTAIAGVERVEVNLVAGGISTLSVSSGAPLTSDSLAAALDEAGDYQLSKMSS